MINVIDIMRRVVGDVQIEWDTMAETPEKPYFMHGPYVAMVNKLIRKDQGKTSKGKKYPAILIPEPFQITETESGCEAILTVVIVGLSEKNADPEDSYAHNFNPTLFPIAELLRGALLNSREVNEQNVLFEMQNHPYWRSDGAANMANDYVDAIEITNLKLNFLKNC